MGGFTKIEKQRINELIVVNRRIRWRILKEKYPEPEGTREEPTTRELPNFWWFVQLLAKCICRTEHIGMKESFTIKVKW